MEDMNGIDVLKKVRLFDPAIIVVFISGNENPE
jgi:two-component SAPR family response regulator